VLRYALDMEIEIARELGMRSLIDGRSDNLMMGCGLWGYSG
jgi:hypothetical protein